MPTPGEAGGAFSEKSEIGLGVPHLTVLRARVRGFTYNQKR